MRNSIIRVEVTPDLNFSPSILFKTLAAEPEK